MIDKRIITLAHPLARSRAIQAVQSAPDGYIVTVSEPTRTLEQNTKLWPMLSDISKQVDWYGNKLSGDEWKDVFSAALKAQKVVPGLNGGFVVCGQSTSKMGKKAFADLIELMYAFGAEHNVRWSEPGRYREVA